MDIGAHERADIFTWGYPDGLHACFISCAAGFHDLYSAIGRDL
ncbi:Unknown protein sequence [Pseudomonas syringae pv. cilantro]|uniref:Uncharacterized protein n=1 Tax=Pseudomonas syringae pv. cilantro TaxID=81035 RepID=A0A0N0GFA2_PSESX|nr:Unknown protein sequence [Pseudomonas syringae pv. cilantro]